MNWRSNDALWQGLVDRGWFYSQSVTLNLQRIVRIPLTLHFPFATPVPPAMSPFHLLYFPSSPLINHQLFFHSTTKWRYFIKKSGSKVKKSTKRLEIFFFNVNWKKTTNIPKRLSFFWEQKWTMEIKGRRGKSKYDFRPPSDTWKLIKFRSFSIKRISKSHKNDLRTSWTWMTNLIFRGRAVIVFAWFSSPLKREEIPSWCR